VRARAGKRSDAAAIAVIYNEGIAERGATFETEPRGATDVEGWFDERHPIVVVEGEEGNVVGFAATFEYRPRSCYDGVAEFSVYVRPDARRQDVGRLALEALAREAESRGFWKLLSRVFVENESSLALLRASGFRAVGTYARHGRLEGEWRDVVIVERLLGPALE